MKLELKMNLEVGGQPELNHIKKKEPIKRWDCGTYPIMSK